ncbi:hypothetical protein ACTXQV_63285, partial [Klebsiella pneumoniae]
DLDGPLQMQISQLDYNNYVGVIGIGLTLLPVLYSYAGFGAQPPSVGQRRFINDSDSYLNMYESLTSRLASEPWYSVSPGDVFPEEFRHWLCA